MSVCNFPDQLVICDIAKPVVVHSEKGRRFTMENRPSWGLSLCLSGQITYSMQGKEFVSHPGSVVFLPRGGNYSLRGDKTGLFPVINFQCANEPFFDEIVLFTPPHPQECIRRFETLQDLFFQNENRLKIFSAFYALLGDVLSSRPGVCPPLAPVLEYIEHHLDDASLSNTVLAQMAGISEVYLRKLFHAHLHCSPKQYILAHRLQHARRLLCDASCTVSAVSEACGFGSLYHFSRCFKEKTGMTPTEYARANQTDRI